MNKTAELEKLLGKDFEGILSSDCFSAYSPQGASAKQKCLAHLEYSQADGATPTSLG